MNTAFDLSNYREMDVNQPFSLIKARRTIMWSWGARNWTNINNKGLLFRVSGFKHKGKVLIALNGSDLYNVILLNTRDRVIDTIEDLYFDDLVNAIDNRIEKTENYEKDVREATY